ncbi:MAG: translational machinery protein [Telluria sp.]
MPLLPKPCGRRHFFPTAVATPLRRHHTPSFTTKVIMSLNNAVVWIDHTKAQVIHFDKDASDSESMKTHSTHPHPHLRHGDTHATEDDNTKFFNDIAAALTDAEQILIVGPAQEKTVFVTHLTANMPAIAGKIKAVETVDHPSNGELLNHARKYFVSAGGLR